MGWDAISKRFSKKTKDKKLHDLSQSGRSIEDIEAEKELIEKTEKVKPIQAQGKVGRNDPCPCGSGKKFKACCGRKN